MIEGRIVTDQQAKDLQDVFFDSDTFFNFVQETSKGVSFFSKYNQAL